MKKQLMILLATLMALGPVSVMQAMDDWSKPLEEPEAPFVFDEEPAPIVVAPIVVAPVVEEPIVDVDEEGLIEQQRTHTAFEPKKDAETVAIVESINKEGLWPATQTFLKDTLKSTISSLQASPEVFAKGYEKVDVVVRAFDQKMNDQIAKIKDPRESEAYKQIAAQVSAKLGPVWTAITQELAVPISADSTDRIIDSIIAKDAVQKEHFPWDQEKFAVGLTKLKYLIFQVLNDVEFKKRGGLFGLVGGTVKDNVNPAQKYMLAMGRDVLTHNLIKDPIDLAPMFITFLTDVITNKRDYLNQIMFAANQLGSDHIDNALTSLGDFTENDYKLDVTELNNLKAKPDQDKTRLQTEATVYMLNFLKWILGVATGAPRSFIFDSANREADIEAIKTVLNSNIVKNTNGNEALAKLRAMLMKNLSAEQAPIAASASVNQAELDKARADELEKMRVELVQAQKDTLEAQDTLKKTKESYDQIAAKAAEEAQKAKAAQEELAKLQADVASLKKAAASELDRAQVQQQEAQLAQQQAEQRRQVEVAARAQQEAQQAQQQVAQAQANVDNAVRAQQEVALDLGAPVEAQAAIPATAPGTGIFGHLTDDQLRKYIINNRLDTGEKFAEAARRLGGAAEIQKIRQNKK